MKILYVCKSLPHRYQGGIQTHTSELAAHLAQRGQDIHILTAGSLKKGENRYSLNGCTVIEIPYIPFRRQPILPTFLEELSFNVSAWWWLQKNQHHYDIVHLQGRSGFLFPKQRNKTLVLTTFHGLIELENRFSHQILNFDKKLHQRFAAYFEKNALNNSDAIIAVSHEMQKELRPLHHRNTKPPQYIVPNGVTVKQTTIPAREMPENDHLLVFVGRLERIKGIFNLVEAMKWVNRDIQLVLIGDGKDRMDLEKLIRTEGVSDRIQLLGAQPNDKVLWWIKRSFALVLPSFHETQGIVLLEANACGIPVVAANVGGVPEVVQHGFNGFLFDPYNIQDIAQAINQLYQNPEKAKAMGKNGQQRIAEKFSWAQIAADTEGVYDYILANKHKNNE